MNKLSFLQDVDPTTRITLGIGVLVFHENKVLLEKREDCGLWCWPGGRMVAGEDVQATALRELKEETNIDATIQGLLGIYSNPQYGTITKYSDDSFSQQIIDVIFYETPESSEKKKSNASLDVEYLDI